MANGMWPAVSGAVARSQVVDVVANNLAGAGNANDLLLTPRQVFGGASLTW